MLLSDVTRAPEGGDVGPVQSGWRLAMREFARNKLAVIGLGIAALYLMQKAWEVGVARFADSQSPAASMARRAASAMEELGRRPFRRPV